MRKETQYSWRVCFPNFRSGVAAGLEEEPGGGSGGEHIAVMRRNPVREDRLSLVVLKEIATGGRKMLAEKRIVLGVSGGIAAYKAVSYTHLDVYKRQR